MNFKILSILFTLTIANNSMASVRAVNDAAENSTGSQAVSGIYKFSSDTALVPVRAQSGDLNGENSDDQEFLFKGGETVALARENSNEVSVTFLNWKEESVSVDRIILENWQLKGVKLQFEKIGGVQALYPQYASNINAIPKPEKRLGNKSLAGRGRARMHWNGATGCVASVLKSLSWTGPQANGVGVTSLLKNVGWHTTTCSNPPVGAVASWSGGSGAGHTARWNGSCWKYDIACDTSTSGPGSSYHLKECVAR